MKPAVRHVKIKQIPIQRWKPQSETKTGENEIEENKLTINIHKHIHTKYIYKFTICKDTK